jgi:aspartate/methionine/tyrosine aminotransferase
MRPARRSKVDPFIVMDVMEAARRAEEAGRHIIHMEVGQPGTPAPAGARRALAAAMEAGALGYTVALGLPELRARIASHYRDWYGVDLDPARVVVTPGSSGAFILAFTALFDAGARVGIGAPGYPSYRQILRALDLVAVDIETSAENRLQPAPDDLMGRDLAGLLVASPANPSGTMLDPSALEITDDCYVINSFSKYFSMTGWRIGWMVVPEDHVRTIERLAQNLFICPPHASQIAALAAMDCSEELEGNMAVYRANRALMLDGLPKAGFDRIAPPDGAFYVYADVRHLTDDSRALAAEILDKAGVAVTPGLDFDPARGAGTLRFSYARGTADIEEGLARLAAFMAARG